MGGCMLMGGCRGLHVVIVLIEKGMHETCGARVALDSEQT
jgi:hypothetical protein